MFFQNIEIFLNELSDHFWLTRFVYLRILGAVYFFAFLSLVWQVIPLLGDRGLTPASQYLKRMRPYFNTSLSAFWRHPTIFWIHLSDNFLRFLACLGLVLSGLVLCGFANKIILIALWLIYLSFIHVGQVWYGYGWETELLENGFMAIGLVGFIDWNPFSSYKPPALIIFLLIWLAFRVNFGSGLIKWRGDECWRNLTCLYYHFETQPLPNPLSTYFHFLPRAILRLGTLLTLISQVIVPWFLFVPG